MTINSNGYDTMSELSKIVIMLAKSAVLESIKVRMRMVTMAYGMIFTLKRFNRTVRAVSITKKVISNSMNITCLRFLYSSGRKNNR